MSNLSSTGLSRVLTYLKTWITGLLNSKSDTSHTHTKSQITDFPSIPSKTSQLTNDSGFLTTHQSLSNYSTLANTIKSLSISGKTITYTKGDNTTGTLTTQDTNTTYSNFVKSGSGAKAGLVPAPSTTAGTTKYLREDGTWQVPPDHTYTVNNATLTIQKNGTTVKTFTANASSNVTCNITVPTKTSELTNNSFVHNGRPSSNDIILTWEYPYVHLSIDGSYQGGIITSNNIGNFVSTSDRRLKDEIESIPDEILDAWEALEPKQFKYKSDLETDKDGALVHYGWIAQDVESVIKGDRKGDIKSGLWQHEFWDEQEEISREEEYTEEVQTKDGTTETVAKTRKIICIPYKAKGDSYGLRYTECLVVECAYLRRENTRLKTHLASLENRLEQLEQSLK